MLASSSFTATPPVIPCDWKASMKCWRGNHDPAFGLTKVSPEPNSTPLIRPIHTP